MDPFDAKKAFMRLAYSKFKNMPLFLEWAPEQSLVQRPQENKPKTTEDNKMAAEERVAKNLTDTQPPVEENEAEEEEPEPDTTLFVKNINFKTTEDDLKQV